MLFLSARLSFTVILGVQRLADKRQAPVVRFISMLDRAFYSTFASSF